jgi:glycerophosphoryl diester phosphodiesterase
MPPPRRPGDGWLAARRTPRPLAFAHRGGAAHWPENTLTAFRGGVEAGVDALETDLHMSRDGVLVLAHDATVDRTTNGKGEIAKLDYSELRHLDAGYRFRTEDRSFPFRGLGLRMPRFAELAELDGDFVINVEIKSDDPRIPEALCDAISHHALVQRIIVAGEDGKRLNRFRAVANRRFGGRGRRGVVATSASRAEVYKSLAAASAGIERPWRPKFDALQVPPRSGRLSVVTPRLLRWAHALDIQVHVWTIDYSNEMDALLRLGVDGLMSDHPDRLMKTLERWGLD